MINQNNNPKGGSQTNKLPTSPSGVPIPPPNVVVKWETNVPKPGTSSPLKK